MGKPHKAFVSSTYEDLKSHRGYVIDVLRDASIHVDPMENWTADSDEPKRFSQDRVLGCDLCILLVARRRGYVPEGETRSITQLEYDSAIRARISVLVFLLDDESPWPTECDERDRDPALREWRTLLQQKHGVGFFSREPESVPIDSALLRLWDKSEQSVGGGERIIGQRPLDVTSHFKDRVEEIAQLRQLVGDQTVKLICIVGRGGAGKTALLSKLCDEIERAELRLTDAASSIGADGIVYVSCRGTEKPTVEKLFNDVGRVLGNRHAKELRDCWQDVSRSFAEKIGILLGKMRKGCFLLVLDNLEDILGPKNTIADAQLREFMDLCLATRHALRIIATSRERLLVAGEGLRATRLISLDEGLPETDAVALLRDLEKPLGNPPPMAERLPEFDSSGSRPHLLVVNRSRLTTGDHDEWYLWWRKSKSHKMGMQISCGVHSEVSAADAVWAVAPALGGGAA